MSGIGTPALSNSSGSGITVSNIVGITSTGQATMANSFPVVIASNQTAIPISFTPSGTQDVNLTKVGGTAFSLGQQLAAASLPVVLTAAQITTLTPLSSVAVTQSTSPWIIAGAGTAGSAATGVATIQGIASMTPVQVSQATGTNLHAVIDSGTITTVSTVTNLSQMNGVAISMDAGATGTGTQRVVQANNAGKTLVSVTGQATSSGNTTLIAAGTNRLKVYAFSISTNVATAVTVTFQSGTGGTALWRVVLQAPTSVGTGANLAISPPAWLFATASATLLNINLSAAVAVDWSISYYDEA